jgi:integrase
MKFTDGYLKGIKPKSAAYDVRERDGFTIRVFPSGKISFQYVYRIDGRLKRMTLGPYPALTLAEARKKHRALLDLRALGKDPAQKSVDTVAELCTEYLDGWARPRKKSAKEDERIIKHDILPAIGKLTLSNITRRDVARMIADIERRAPNQAWQVLKITRRMFNFGIERGMTETNPCLLIKMQAPTVKKDRALTVEEIKFFWNGMERFGVSDSIVRCLKTILTTAQRPGEVLGIHSDEISGDWWTIPAERSKNGRAHCVYLSPLAKSLIGERDGLAFPSVISGERMDTPAVATAVRRMLVRKDGKGMSIPAFTPHDLRRTAATHIAALGFDHHLIGRLLNHTDQSVTAIYNRHSYDAEKKEMLLAWADRLQQIVSAS